MMKNSKSRSSEKVSFSIPLIILVVLVLTVSFLIQGAFILTSMSGEVKSTQTDNFTIITQSITDFLELEIQTTEKFVKAFGDQIARNLAETGSDSLGSSLDYHDILMDLYDSSSYYESAFLLDTEGTVVDSTFSTGMLGLDLADREYYKAIAEDGKTTFTATKALQSVATGNLTVVHSAAVRVDGELKGIIAVSLNLTSFAKAFIHNKRVGSTGYPYILDREGLIIVHPSEDLIYTPSQDVDPFFQTVVDSRERVQNISYQLGGSDKQGVFIRMPSTQWIVCLAINDSEAFHTTTSLREMLLISSFLLILVISLILSVYIKKKLVIKLNGIEQILFKASEGDLTQKGRVKGRDEIAGMIGYINVFLDSLRHFFGTLKGSLGDLEQVGQELSANMEETAAAVYEIRTNVENSRTHIDQQESSVSETVTVVQDIIQNIRNLDENISQQDINIQQGSSAIEQMIAQIKNVSTSTEEAEKIMEILKNSADLGQENLNNVSLMIDAIAEKSRKLEDANTLIAGIAARTNLLAMNAAIEAAHAGDAGRGFAVVADEIRKLAEQSTTQSAEVKLTISDIAESFDSIVRESKSTSSSFEEIQGNMDSMGRITGEIKSSMEEQVAGSSQVLQSLEEMKSAGMDIMAGSREMTEGNNRILKTIQSLTQISSEVSMAMKEIGNGMDEISNSVQNVSEIALRNQESINNVKTEASFYSTEEISDTEMPGMADSGTSDRSNEEEVG